MTTPQPGASLRANVIRLTDNASKSYDLVLDGGESSIQEVYTGQDPFVSGGVGKYSDFEAGVSFIEMGDWSRGFGQYDYNDDQSKYYDGFMAWTATQNKLYPSIAWNYSSGLTGGNASWSTSVSYQHGFPRASGTGYEHATLFTVGGTGYSAKNVYAWIYVVKSFTSLTVSAKLYSDSGGDPDSLLGTSASFNKGDFELFVWKMVKFTFATPVALTASTNYHVAISMDTGTEADTGVSAGITAAALTGNTSADGWSTASPSYPLCVAVEPNLTRYCYPFILENGLFAVTIHPNSGAGKLFINGDRGKATAGDSTTLTDSNEGLRGAWTTNQWAGAVVWITAGTGKGQARTIASNTDAGVLTVSSVFLTNPDATSQYVICNTGDWVEIDAGGTGIGVVTSVAVANDVVYFAEGFGGNIRRANFNDAATPPAMRYDDDSTNDADVLTVANGFVWRGTNDDGKIAKAPIAAWGTDLVFTDMDSDTGYGFDFTNIIGHGNRVYAFKENSIWYFDPNGTEVFEYPVNVKYMPDNTNGQAVCSSEEYLYFNWAYALERLNGLTVDHLDPNAGAGMPDGRQGAISAMAPHPAGLFFTIDALDGTSLSLVFDGLSFHEVCRVPVAGERMRSLLWQPIPGYQPILWTGVGDNLIYQKFPYNHTNPLKDSTVIYSHTMEWISSTIDLGAKGLKKLFKDIEVIGNNLSSAITEGYLFYQTDGNIGSSTWTRIGLIAGRTASPIPDSALATINALSNIQEIRFRLVFYCDIQTTPPTIDAITLKGYGRKPLKKQWSIKVNVAETAKNLGGGDPKTFVDWYVDKSENAEALLAESKHSLIHNQTVILIPRSLRTDWIDNNKASFSGSAYIEVRQA